VRVSRYLWVAALSLGCTSRTLSPMATSGGSETDGGATGEESTESESESGSETGDPIPACTTEWDCGVGERCLDGLCTCLGCACQSPNIASGTIGAPDEDEDEVPVFFDVASIPDVGSECEQAADCGPLEACEAGQCVATSDCVEDLECRADWWPEYDRFCIDGLCQELGCDYELDGDTGCPAGAICNSGCEWLEVVPTCMEVPSFDEVEVHPLDALPQTVAFVILDVDLDGRDDIVVLEDGFIYWLTSNGVGFGPPTPWEVEPGTQIVGIASADIHGDGIAELLVSHADPLGVEFLAAGPSWPQWVGFAETMDVPEDATMLDVDYDGLPDLVTGTIIGQMTLVEARLGDATGTFGPLWVGEVERFEFSQPHPARDNALACERALGSTMPYDFLGWRSLDHEETSLIQYLAGSHRSIAGHMFFPSTPQRPAGFVATAGLVDRGVLFFEGGGLLELAPDVGAVALLSRDEGIQHALVDHGIDDGEFVEFAGDPLAPLCRGFLGFELYATVFGVGDFDGDGREDLLGHGGDNVLRAWLSRD
jgi:hypothetical protein